MKNHFSTVVRAHEHSRTLAWLGLKSCFNPQYEVYSWGFIPTQPSQNIDQQMLIHRIQQPYNKSGLTTSQRGSEMGNKLPSIPIHRVTTDIYALGLLLTWFNKLFEKGKNGRMGKEINGCSNGSAYVWEMVIHSSKPTILSYGQIAMSTWKHTPKEY